MMHNCTITILPKGAHYDDYQVWDAYYSVDSEGIITFEYITKPGETFKWDISEEDEEQVMTQLEEEEVCRRERLQKNEDTY